MGVSVRPRSLLAFAGLCAAATAAVAVLQRLQFTYGNGSLKIALETTATLAAVVTSYLLLGRVQRTRALHELVLACGLTVLAFSNFVFATLAAVGSPKSPDVIWEPLIGTAASAVLIAISSMLPRRQTSLSAKGARRIVFGVATTFVVLMLVIVADPSGFLPQSIYAGAPTAASEAGVEGHPILTLVQALLAIAYAIAAFGFVRQCRETGDDLSRWLAVA
jgi:hypothetical protein